MTCLVRFRYSVWIGIFLIAGQLPVYSSQPDNQQHYRVTESRNSF